MHRRRPLLIAWAATISGVSLALAPGFYGGVYDPTLAVLTATLIGIVWYTYFTYALIRKREPAYLRLRLSFDWEELVLTPGVRNPTASRVLKVRTHCRVLVDGEPVDLGPFYRGEEEVVLGPGDRFLGALNIRNRVWERTDGEGRDYFDKHKVVIELSARWTDESGETGATPVRRWLIDLDNPVFTALLGPSEVERHLGEAAVPGSIVEVS